MARPFREHKEDLRAVLARSSYQVRSSPPHGQDGLRHLQVVVFRAYSDRQ